MCEDMAALAFGAIAVPSSGVASLFALVLSNTKASSKLLFMRNTGAGLEKMCCSGGMHCLGSRKIQKKNNEKKENKKMIIFKNFEILKLVQINTPKQ